MVKPGENQRPPNHVGTVSLVISAAGFAAFEIAQGAWDLSHPAWSLVRGGFEASLIGGVADWFAVRALFHPIPRPGRWSLPHTDLVVRNRGKLTDGLVDLVENQLLSPASVAAQLKDFSASQLVLSQLDSDPGRALAGGALRSLGGRFANELDDAGLRTFLAALLRQQVREAPLAPVAGRWLRDRVAEGGTRILWTTIAHFLAERAQAHAFDAYLEEALVAAVRAVKDESWWKGQAAKLFVNPRKDAAHVRNALAAVLTEQAADPAHPLHAKLDEIVATFAQQLIDGDPAATAHVQAFQRTLAEQGDFEQLVGTLLTQVRETMQTQLAAPSADLDRVLDGLLTRTTENLRADPAARASLDDWVRRALQDLAVRYHSVIGETARRSMERFPDRELVGELESKVGGDLQFIRLNGAIIGGLVGVLIAAVKWAL